VSWQASLKQRRERRLSGAGSAEYVDQHIQSLPQSAPTRRVPIGSSGAYSEVLRSVSLVAGQHRSLSRTVIGVERRRTTEESSSA
jgi:hypothetical protein